MNQAISPAKLNAVIEAKNLLGSNILVSSEVYELEKQGKLMRGTLSSIRKYAVAQRRGVYDISNIINGEPLVNAPTPVAKKEQPVMIEQNISYIPKADPLFVRFGFYADLLKLLNTSVFAPVYITGETGNGKTMTVLQACAAAKRECIPVNITNETAEEDLIGSQTLIDGNLVWKDGPALIAMKRGAVLLLDEIDQGTSRLLCIQTILQSHTYYNKKTSEIIEAADGFQIVATGNTIGDGMGQDVYIGAQLMNAAFLDRFPITFKHDYPPAATERRILSKFSLEEDVIDKLVNWAQFTRQTKAAGAIDHSITTRRLVQVATNIGIFDDVEKSISLAIARFDSRHSLAFLDLWKKMQDDDSTTVSGKTDWVETRTYTF